MKKTIILSVALLLIIAAGANAQEDGVTKGTGLLNIGVGTGGAYSGFTSALPVTLSYERGVANDLSFGGQVSYAHATYDDGYGDNIGLTAIYIGARGSYHFGTVLKLPSKIDLYAGVSLGYVVESVSDSYGDGYAASSGVGYGFFVGGKYFFSQKVGVFVEAGYQSLSTGSAGLAFKF
jgi:hypothetical protein